MSGFYGTDSCLNLQIGSSIKDLMKPKSPKNLGEGKNVYNYIKNSPEFSLTTFLIQLAKLENMLAAPQFDTTIFITPDKYLLETLSEDVIKNMDLLTARNLLLYNMLNGYITVETLKSSKHLKLKTRIPLEISCNLFSDLNEKNQIVLNKGVINNSSAIVIDKLEQKFCNGMVQVTSNICIPDTLNTIILNKQAVCKNDTHVNYCNGNYQNVRYRQ